MRIGRVALLLLIVLVSAAVLVAAGGLGLWRELRHTGERAQLDARRATIATADAIRRALRDPHVLELVEVERRFAVADGQCVVPPDVLAALPLRERPEEELPAPLRDQVAEARRVATSDATQAAAIYAEVGASPLLDARQRGFVTLLAGMHAMRSGDAAARAAALAALADGENAYRAVVGGVLVLAASIGEAPPEWAIARAAELDDELAQGVVLRLCELGAHAVAERVVARRAAVARARHVVDAAAKRLVHLLGASGPVALPAGDELLLFFPDSENAGRGAVVDPVVLLRELEARHALDPVPWTGVVVRADEAGADAEPVVASCSLVPPPPPPSALGGPLGLGIVLGAAVLCFAFGLLATWRVLRAETAAVRLRIEFLQSVTHELKTPLASIRLLAERLESGRVDDARRRDYYAMLADEGTRLAVLIENVLDLGRIERGERSYDLREQDLGAVVREALDVFAPLAQRDGIALEVSGELGGVTGRVDRGAIVQALLNVLENARKHAKDGARVAVRCAVQDDELAIDVRDFGPGIPAHERGAIFTRFTRGQRAKDGAIAGVGLGLYLARSIVRAHGGELDCVEPDGPGAEFRFRIPLDANAKEAS